MPTKRTILYPDNNVNRSKAPEASEPIDASALAKALKDYDQAGRQRERTPGTSPCRKRQRVYGDRYVPNARDKGRLQALPGIPRSVGIN
jgi:cell division cycle 20-like protein 1 (cofactor of APC complex)